MTTRRTDVLVALALAMAVGAAAFSTASTLDARFLNPTTGNDIWFEADLGRIADEMTHRWAAHSRATVHPLFALVTVVAAYALRAAGASPATAVSAVTALAAAAWTLACYALVRTIVPRRGDAVLLVLLTISSAAGQFWLSVPETAALGSATVMAALATVALRSERWVTAGVAASLAITVTNVMAGLVAAAAVLPWRRAVQAAANGLAIVVVLWCVQRAVVPYADFFVGYSNEDRYLLRPEAGGPGLALRAVAVSGMMMPRAERVEKPRRGPILSVQRVDLSSQTVLWKSGALLWVALIISGGVATLTYRGPWDRYGAVLAVLGLELVLYAIYGTESFLYALNVVPLLVLVVGAGLRGKAAPVVRAAVVTLLTIAAVNNVTRLRESRGYFEWRSRSVGSGDPTPTSGRR